MRGLQVARAARRDRTDRVRWCRELERQRCLAGVWHRLVADGRDLAGRHPRPRLEELLEMGDVVGLDDEECRVLRKRKPVTADLNVLHVAVEKRGRAPLAIRTVLRSVRLLDVEQHAALLPSMAPCALGPPLTAFDAHYAIPHISYHCERVQERVEYRHYRARR